MHDPELASGPIKVLVPTRIGVILGRRKEVRHDRSVLGSEARVRRIEPFFPLSHGVPRVDDRRVISGIILVIRNGLRWRDAPRRMDHPRPYTTASCAGADWVYSTA